MPPFTSDSPSYPSGVSPTGRRDPPTFISIPKPRRVSTLQRITFRWHHSAASKVVLTGTFDDWAQSITMPRDPNCRDEFCVTLVLDRLVRHEFKFVVDGEWRCSYAFPTVFDSNGFVNNVIEPVGLDVLATMAFDPETGAAMMAMATGKRRAGSEFGSGRLLTGTGPYDACNGKRTRVAY